MTLGLAAHRRFPWAYTPGYVIAQFTGAIAAAAVTWGLYGDQARAIARLGAPAPAKGPALGAGRRGLPVTGVPRGALPRGRRRGAGLGLFIGSALNLVFGVPSASTAGASG